MGFCSHEKQQETLCWLLLRLPSSGSQPVEELNNVLHQIDQRTKNSKNAIVILGGDFNAPNIDWDTGTITEGSRDKKMHETVVTTLRDNHLSQVQREPTRLENTLDLLCTNKPGLVKTISIVPGLSLIHI